MRELIEALNQKLQDTQFVIYLGKQSEADAILGSDYQLEKSFLKKIREYLFLKS